VFAIVTLTLLFVVQTLASTCVPDGARRARDRGARPDGYYEQPFYFVLAVLCRSRWD